MMRLILFPLCLFATQIAAQTASLPVDERGVHTFLEISELNAAKKETMPANIRHFFKSNAKALKLRSSKGDTAFSGTGKMILTKSTAGIGHPTAEVNYNILVELRENKYRLILTDYIVTPYERDRYANFVPSTTKYRLEDKPGKLNRGEWEANMKYVITESGKLSEKLKTAMNTTQAIGKPESEKPAAVSTTKW